ncbi:HK97-gp10 family putative phage morphogenesis protein [Pantoea agglomerans]|jgi:HK97 gp10 family phage protein|uniref:HK97-gp10 family putative phage morphogenesis protein n=1 Tax=Enterobacter agglomerans TaxID=549 RepID=UPI000255435C|nr:HK97-gp10 family putative phage morphogenesis protein [Pantoea agglomerans]
MIRMEVTGLAELERQLIALGEKAGTKVLREAGKAALEIVEQDMKEHAGYDESAKGPHMRDSIKIRSTTRTKGNAVVVLRVGPSKQHYIKALAQEFGTVKQIPDPFIRPALDYNKSRVLRILAVEIRDRIQNNG